MTDTFTDRFRSALQSAGAKRKPDELRQSFRKDFTLQPIRAATSHSHASAAALRSGMNHQMNAWVRQRGLLPYAWCKSSREDCDGYRPMFRPADYKQKYSRDRLTANHVIVITDSDYYCDMPHMLKLGLPIILYTFVPVTAAGTIPDGVFCWRAGQLVVDVNGGAHYEHGIWDYCSRDLITSQPTWFGSVWCYDVDYKICPGDFSRRVIFLNPAVNLPWYSHIGITLPVLQRYQACHRSGTVTVRFISSEDKPTVYVSVGREGEHMSVTLPLPVVIELNQRNKAALDGKNNKGRGMPISDIERVLRAAGIPQEQSGPQAALLHSCLPIDYAASALVPGGAPLNLTPQSTELPPPGSIHYQPMAVDEALEEGTEVGRRIANPIVPPGCENMFPNECRESDIVCVAERIDKVRNRLVPPTRYRQFAEEFCRHVVPDKIVGQGAPWDEWQVSEEQPKPLQQERLEQERHMGILSGHGKIKSFQKKESYDGVKPPRNISTVPTSHTMNLSRFTYPFKNSVLKQHSWYAPGLHPRDIENRVAKLVVGKDQVMGLDFSKFDGTISEWLRENVEFPVYRRWFARNHHTDLDTLFRAEMTNVGVTKHKIRYQPGASRRSGSPLTTDGNTILNCFVGYVANRLAGQEPGPAWKALGLYYGDDGLAHSPDPEMYELAARNLGLELKLEVIKAGGYVTFLQRVFLDPWTTLENMQNPFCIRKMHLSGAPRNVPDAVVCMYKAAGYLATDYHTPLVGDYARAMYKTALRSGLHEQYSADQLAEFRRQVQADVSWWSRYETLDGAVWTPVRSTDRAKEVQSMILEVTTAELDAVIEDLEWVVAGGLELEDVAFVNIAPTGIKVDAVVGGYLVTRYEPKRPALQSLQPPSGTPRPLFGTGRHRQAPDTEDQAGPSWAADNNQPGPAHEPEAAGSHADGEGVKPDLNGTEQTAGTEADEESVTTETTSASVSRTRRRRKQRRRKKAGHVNPVVQSG